MRTRFLGIALLCIIIFGTTFFATTNKVLSPSNSNKQTYLGSSRNNTPHQINDDESDLFDVNVSINVKVTLDDKVKGVKPNIIRATRQALFDRDCDLAKFSHYNGYSRNYYINIFDVIDKGNDTWEVRFREKEKESDFYDYRGYSIAEVKRDNSGSYQGTISGSRPCMQEGETF